ncbi:SpoIID/LytB domain-containing protein [archaeon]|nr:SpoIID/LytB domain-containing protein [archaeon]
MVAFETYVKRVLAQEWINCWGSQTGGMNSLQAGAVAIRSYAIRRIANLASCHGANYDICRTICCQVYGITQYTNSNNAVDNTANNVLGDLRYAGDLGKHLGIKNDDARVLMFKGEKGSVVALWSPTRSLTASIDVTLPSPPGTKSWRVVNQSGNIIASGSEEHVTVQAGSSVTYIKFE